MVRVITDGGTSIVTPERAVSPMMRYFNSPDGYRVKKKKPLRRFVWASSFQMTC